jgi:hypothetical protein
VVHYQLMKPGCRLLLLLAIAAWGGCSHSPHRYAPTDEFFASGRFPVPSEFRRGTASRAEVDAWSASLLGANPLESRRLDIDGDGAGELFISQPAQRGTGGNSYLVFREGRRGFSYLGTLEFGLLRPLAKDGQGRVRVLTGGSMGGCECLVIIQMLQPDGFHSAANRVLPCGDGAADGEGGRLFKLLFDPESPPEDILRRVFGAEL